MTEVPAPPRGCPDPSILAAFVEGTLDAHSRREVERHVADCYECPGVIAETALFLNAEHDSDEAEAEADPPPRGRWWLAIAAAVLALCTASVWLAVVKRDPLRRIKKIVAESGTRPIEGQLADFEYAPFPARRSDRGHTDDLALRAEAERLSASDDTDALTLHARGVALLLVGDTSHAVVLLTAAIRADPNNAAFANDRAAALLALAQTRDRQSRSILEAALADAENTVKRAPAFAPAHFNRAVILQYLGRGTDAISEYRAVVELDPGTRWSDEAQNRIALLSD